MSFYIRLLILTILLLAISYASQLIPANNIINHFAYSSILFFAVITWLIYFITHRSIAGSNHRQFSTAVMAGMTIKLFASALFVLIYSLIKKPESILIVLPFFVYYLCYTVLEVYEYLRLNRSLQSK
jgi:hypothetical protein